MFVRMLRSLIWLGSPTAQIYKGLLIKANPDPHPELAHRLQGLLPAGSRVLDFGAGQGALSMRLKDLGYEVVAVDQDADSFLAKEVPFFHLDFNDSPQVSQC
ncbi:MAG: hypothetical protein H3C59_12205, partial [Burkholderiaceae bacterium]|nr:hypothetical protein [Burkholderiaceae bacterium]